MDNKEKWVQYATLINSQIAEMFTEDSENYIDLEELSNFDNIKHFIHALATVVPNVVYNKFTANNQDNLEFNHIANHLCFEFCKND